MRRSVLGPLTLVLTLSGPAVGAPDEPGRRGAARQLLKEGNELFAAKKFAAALSRFEKAYELYPSAKLLFNLASSHEALDHRLLAADLYQRFLTESGFDSREKLVKEAKERLERLDRKLGRIVIDPQPGMRYELDDQPIVPEKTAPIRVVPGAHVITAHRSGHQSRTQTLQLAAGEKKRVEMTLVPNTPPAAVAIPPPPAPPPPPPQSIVETAPPEPESDPLTEQWWFWTAIVGAAAVAAGATAAIVVTQNREFQLDTDEGVSSIDDWDGL